MDSLFFRPPPQQAAPSAPVRRRKFGGKLAALACLAALHMLPEAAWGTDAAAEKKPEPSAQGASAPEPRAIASSHAYEAYLMACRALDAGDTAAAKNWLKQVLVFDPDAREPKAQLEQLERREQRTARKAPSSQKSQKSAGAAKDVQKRQGRPQKSGAGSPAKGR